MEVILKEDVPKLGSRGDVVKVAEGFGRNYLLPQKLAIEASSGNKKVIEQMKAASVRRSALNPSRYRPPIRAIEVRNVNPLTVTLTLGRPPPPSDSTMLSGTSKPAVFFPVESSSAVNFI